jgi:hypothetical protein
VRFAGACEECQRRCAEGLLEASLYRALRLSTFAHCCCDGYRALRLSTFAHCCCDGFRALRLSTFAHCCSDGCLRAAWRRRLTLCYESVLTH